jgi:hypothetical protein
MDQAALLDAYYRGPERLRSAVTGLSREQMNSRPITGRWSVLEAVFHLVDTDVNIAQRSGASGCCRSSGWQAMGRFTPNRGYRVAAGKPVRRPATGLPSRTL